MEKAVVSLIIDGFDLIENVHIVLIKLDTVLELDKIYAIFRYNWSYTQSSNINDTIFWNIQKRGR